ncbi:hypothetical protein [Gallibacterium anatis]|uniref:Uncharacterized protein n=1 Tax=Gallibacterium anatis TaxID=750 RepID=A0A0A2X783_9PAST|nr:hypothetical protein [Gallibacterium anatis]KGQ28246.1 hypothetical protein JP32_12055 [Gallibacterium anatis]
MSKTIILKINNGKSTIKEFFIQANKGQTLVIKAQAKVNYQFIDENTGFGPEIITTKRVGDDLVVVFERGGMLTTQISF